MRTRSDRIHIVDLELSAHVGVSEEERAHTLYGLLVCATTTILVFGILATSSVPVLHAIGVTAALGSFCCLLFTGIMATKERHVSV